MCSDRKSFGVIGAMEEEIVLLKAAMKLESTERIADMEFCVGTLGGKRLALAHCGMGKVNAAICAQLLISRFGAECIVNTGVAGSLDRHIDVGDIVVSSDAVQYDYDVSPIGFAKGEIPYTGLAAVPADAALRQRAVSAVRRCAPEVRVFEGRVCSGDRFIASQAQKDKITEEFGGPCCEMEGAAIAQVCTLNHIPFVILRAVSDKADTEIEVDFAAFSREAAHRCADVVREMIETDDAC